MICDKCKKEVSNDDAFMMVFTNYPVGTKSNEIDDPKTKRGMRFGIPCLCRSCQAVLKFAIAAWLNPEMAAKAGTEDTEEAPAETDTSNDKEPVKEENKENKDEN